MAAKKKVKRKVPSRSKPRQRKAKPARHFSHKPETGNKTKSILEERAAIIEANLQFIDTLASRFQNAVIRLGGSVNVQPLPESVMPDNFSSSLLTIGDHSGNIAANLLATVESIEQMI